MRRVRPYVAGRGPGGDVSRWRAALKASCVPPRYWGASVEAIRNKNVAAWARKTIRGSADWLSEGRGWYLGGQLNVGKSSLAAILLMDALKRCETCLWMSVRDVCRVRFNDGSEGREMDRRLRTCDLLVLDDLGSERFRHDGPAGGALEEVARIVYDRQRSLIVTGNMSWRQLGEQYSMAGMDPFVSVLRRMIEPYMVFAEQWPVTPMEGQ